MKARLYILSMMLTGMLVLLLWPVISEARFSQQDTVKVQIYGTGEDARFEPALIRVNKDDFILFTVMEGTHTVTAYHPDNRRPKRIPNAAKAFDSGILTAGQQWTLQIEADGVYDYFCLPHEKMGHVGRIMVGPVDVNKLTSYKDSALPGPVAAAFNEIEQQYLKQNK